MKKRHIENKLNLSADAMTTPNKPTLPASTNAPTRSRNKIVDDSDESSQEYPLTLTELPVASLQFPDSPDRPPKRLRRIEPTPPRRNVSSDSNDVNNLLSLVVEQSRELNTLRRQVAQLREQELVNHRLQLDNERLENEITFLQDTVARVKRALL